MMRAIVTGHSRGLGAAIAAELLSRGAAVMGIARGSNAGLAAQYPDRLVEVGLDLSDPASLAGWLDSGAGAAFLAGGGPVLLVNNAGLLQPIGPAGSLPPGEIARSVAVNVAAPLLLASAFVAATQDVPDRRIVHVASGAARVAYAGWSVYCAGKAALDHHARSVALEGHAGLRICSLAPGVVDTAMQAEIRDADGSRFPLRERFVALKAEGLLAAPPVAAARLLDYVLGDRFGEQAVADLRDAG